MIIALLCSTPGGKLSPGANVRLRSGIVTFSGVAAYAGSKSGPSCLLPELLERGLVAVKLESSFFFETHKAVIQDET